MNYLLGAILVLLQKSLISFANILDSYISNKVFSSVLVICVVNGIILLPLIPIAALILHPNFITIRIVFVIILISFIEFIYQIPYYYALRLERTSVVVSLFSLGKLFIPFFAFFLIREQLTVIQYVGYLFIIISVFCIGFSKGFRVKKVIYFMLPVSALLALQSVLQKYCLLYVKWKTFYFWFLFFSVPFYLIAFFMLRGGKHEIIKFISNPLNKRYSPFYLQNFASWISEALGIYILSIFPVTLVKAMGSFHSVIVHTIASASKKRIRYIIQEKHSYQLLLLLVLSGVGIFLVFLG